MNNQVETEKGRMIARFTCYDCSGRIRKWYTREELIKSIEDEDHTDYRCPVCRRIIVCCMRDDIQTPESVFEKEKTKSGGKKKMPAWNVNNPAPEDNGTTTIRYEKDGNSQTFDFDNEETLFDAVRDIANTKGLTAVNVLVDGEEVSEQVGKKKLSELLGKEIVVVPKNTGSAGF